MLRINALCMNVYNEEKLIKSGFVQQTIKEIVLAVKKLQHTVVISVNCKDVQGLAN
jgi:hypothetical protein